MKKIITVALDAAFIACLVAGYGYGCVGATTVVEFVVTATFILSAFYLFMAESIVKKAPAELAMPAWYITTHIVVCAFIMVWTGHTYVAWAWLVSRAWLYGTRDNIVRSFKEKQA